MRKIGLRLLLACLGALALPLSGTPALGQRASAYSVAPDAAQRRAILDAIRPAVEARLGPNVEFVVHELRIVRGWAFVAATPQRRGGWSINGYDYFPDFDEMGGLEVQAVLRLRGGRWTVVEQDIGATDVWYCDMGPSGLTPACTVGM